MGTTGDAIIATDNMMVHETIQISQKRFHIAGHSLKKWDNSTSLAVDARCMLYPVKCAHLQEISDKQWTIWVLTKLLSDAMTSHRKRRRKIKSTWNYLAEHCQSCQCSADIGTQLKKHWKVHRWWRCKWGTSATIPDKRDPKHHRKAQ